MRQPEKIEQTNGKVDMIIVGVGVSMRVKRYNQNIKIVGVTPKFGVNIQGLVDGYTIFHLREQERFSPL